MVVELLQHIYYSLQREIIYTDFLSLVIYCNYFKKHQEDKFYDEQNLVDEEEDDDEDDFMDTNAQFKEAFQNAKASDTQGYMISSSPTEQLELDEKTGGTQRNAQDLTAISWAVFCVDNLDVTSRIQALDSTSLLDRLKLGGYVLRQKNQALLKELDEFPQAEEEKKGEGDSDEDNIL